MHWDRCVILREIRGRLAMALSSKLGFKFKKKATAVDLTEGPIIKNILLFAIFCEF